MLDDRVEKGGHRGGQAEVWELSQEVGEGLLEDVEGVGFVAGEAPGESIDPVPMPAVERLERLDAAGPGLLQQFLIRIHVGLRDEPLASNRDHCTAIRG
ncbi:MAG TPA: hypothetical protein VLI39_07300 [Sedimentisphaerales bacterium]|nr:hypothetical protein [Sedimentisphaerales bacterium]